MSGISPDAVLGAVVTCGLAGAAALWKLSSMISSIGHTTGRELNHNGGESLKDYAKKAASDAADAAKAASDAKIAAQYADLRTARLEDSIEAFATESSLFRIRVDEREGEKVERMAKLQHDVSAVRTGLALHVYEAQEAQRRYAQETGGSHYDFTTPDDSPLRDDRNPE